MPDETREQDWELGCSVVFRPPHSEHVNHLPAVTLVIMRPGQGCLVIVCVFIIRGAGAQEWVSQRDPSQEISYCFIRLSQYSSNISILNIITQPLLKGTVYISDIYDIYIWHIYLIIIRVRRIRIYRGDREIMLMQWSGDWEDRGETSAAVSAGKTLPNNSPKFWFPWLWLVFWCADVNIEWPETTQSKAEHIVSPHPSSSHLLYHVTPNWQWKLSPTLLLNEDILTSQ